MNLNINGNGFDLYHGLPSSYYYFGCYLIKEQPDLYETIGNMYGLIFRKIYRTYPDFEYDLVVEDIFWREFEKHLGDVDEKFILDTYPDDLYLENDDPIDIDMEDDIVAERLKTAFIQWVNATLDRVENYTLIRKNMRKNSSRLYFAKDDYFLNFNYTHTLQEVYKILDENICYVHGECFDGVDNLIVGHGNDNRIIELKKKIAMCKEDYDYTQSSKNEENEYKCLLRYIQRLRKDVEVCMGECKYFYSRIRKNIDVVKVYGMSMGDVDIPYLKQIKNSCPDARWSFSYFSDGDKMRNKEVAENILKLSANEWNEFHFENASCWDIQDQIVELQDIEKYQKV